MFFSLIKMTGEDAGDFLHRISTVHIHSLKTDEFNEGLFLSSLGKIQSYFMIYKKTDSDFFFFVFDESAKQPWKKYFLEYIEHFHFSEKIQVSECEEKEFLENAPASLQSHIKMLQTLAEEKRIENLQPSVGAEIIFNETNPLEVGLMSAISRTKGCYPGQEVIEKIQAKGSPAYRLCQCVFVDNSSEVLSEIFSKDSGKKCGRITSLSKLSGKFLALLSKTHALMNQELKVGELGLNAQVVQVSEYQS